MKILKWLVPCVLLTWTASSVAQDDPCRVKVGHARPAGCAPFKSKSVKVETTRLKRSSKPRSLEASFEKALRFPETESSRRQSERLLVQELAATERLLRRTPKGAPERARIIRRLAEGYAELERLAALRRIRAELNHARAVKKQSKR